MLEFFIKNRKIKFIIFISAIILLILGAFVFVYQRNLKKEVPKYDNIVKDKISYNEVVRAGFENIGTSSVFESEYDDKEIRWQAKISAYYSQITGIKFCVVDDEHQKVVIDEPCDWFWAFSDKLMDADDLSIHPDWDGRWVNYILNYYKVPFDKDEQFYDEIYTVIGKINGVDCDQGDKCIPDIDIIKIEK